MATKKQTIIKQKKALAYTIMAIVILAIGTIIAIFVASTAQAPSQNSTNSDNSNNSTSQNDDTNDNSDYASAVRAFNALDSQGVLDLLQSGRAGFLYAGRPTCPHCAKFTPLLASVVRSNPISTTVYYYDTADANSDSDKKAAVLEALNVTGVPAFMFINEGKVIEKLSDRSSEAPILTFINSHL